MHLEVTKDNKWRNSGGKKNLKKKIFFEKKIFIPDFFFHQILCIMSFGTQVEAGKGRMPWLHLE